MTAAVAIIRIPHSRHFKYLASSILTRALRAWSHETHFTHEQAVTERGKGTSSPRGKCCVLYTRSCEAQTLPAAFPHPRRQPGNRAISSLAAPGLISFGLHSFLQLLSSTIPLAGQAAPVGIKGAAGSSHKGAFVPRGPPPPATSQPPAAHSPGDSQKGLLPGPGVTSPSAMRAAPEQPGVPAPRVTGRAQVQVVPGPTAGRLLASGQIQGAQPLPVMSECRRALWGRLCLESRTKRSLSQGTEGYTGQ